MRKLKVSKIWISAFLLAVVMVGCSDPDKNARAGNPGDPLTPPTVISVTPLDLSIAVCPNNGLITATFSKAMNPATITTSTFTLTGPPNATSVSGTVTYNSTTFVATFTPSGSLATSTPYTATITTGVADTFGNKLAVAKTWTFTTASAPCGAIGGAIPLGAACSFGILGSTPSVTNTGVNTLVTGDVGIFPAISIVGFAAGNFTGMLHPGDSVAGTARAALLVAYNAAAGAAGGAALTADIGGQTLAPGVYTAPSTLAITGDLTLAGNGVYIFQIPTALTTAAGSPSVPASRVILTGGALAQNVFWETGSAATLGTYSTFAGTIMAQTSITLGTGAVLNGRALAYTGAVTLDSNPVNVPTTCQ
jgi:hypothetical protein